MKNLNTKCVGWKVNDVKNFLENQVTQGAEKVFTAYLVATISIVENMTDKKHKVYLYVSPKHTWEMDVRTAYGSALNGGTAVITVGEDRMLISIKIFNVEKWNYLLIEIEINGEKTDILFLEDLV